MWYDGWGPAIIVGALIVIAVVAIVVLAIIRTASNGAKSRKATEALLAELQQQRREP